MKNICYLSLPLALLLSASSVLAGSRDHPQHGRFEFDSERRVERMTEELGLSDEQRDQLLAVFEASDAEREELRQRIEEQFKPEMCALHHATAEQVREILTDEQEAEFKEGLDLWADYAKGKGRRGHRGGFPQDCEAQG